MYGLVNKAIQQLVCSEFDESLWDEIKRKAGVTVEEFVSMSAYEDALTYDLVGAASEILDIPVPDLLDAFGEYWTVYTATEGYGHILAMAGATLPEFLTNLDAMHVRVAETYPDLKPPSFHYHQTSDTESELHYYSIREGLAPMVVGLVRGLGKRFQVQLRIRHTQKRADIGHDVFALTILESNQEVSES